jgi:RNase adapter protein RapZ
VSADDTEKPNDMNANAKPLSVLLITGMSGAGRTSALKALEDMGYEAIDNVPLSLLGSLVSPPQRKFEQNDLRRPFAIGVDIRTRDFAVESFLEMLERLSQEDKFSLKVVFMECDDEELRRRYTETRHLHPLAADRPVSDGIARERQLLAPLRDRADVVLDTTGLRQGDIKRILGGHFHHGQEPKPTIFVTSFSYRRGLPREADLVFDVRFLANPHYDPLLRPLTGQDTDVAAFIEKSDGNDAFFDSLTGLILPLLPLYAAEGKSYLTLAVGCTGGRHRSVFVAEKLAAWLCEREQSVQLCHRDLDGVIKDMRLNSEQQKPKRQAEEI